MKKLNMRILAALLALLMFVNSCPTFAIATDSEGSNIPETTQATETPATETPATEAPATEPPATDAAAVTQQDPCGTCGKEDCDGNHTNWCAICKKDDCGETHVLCQICQHYDCGVTHVLCQICQNYDCGVTHHFCDICKMYDCIVEGHGATAPADGTEDPTDPTDPAGADGSGEPAAPADHCPWCEDTLGEDGTVIHSELCNAAYAYNGAADVGKYAKMSGDAISYGMDVSANPKTDKTGKQFFSTDFEDNTILRITGWYWDSETTALWYRVGFYSGGAVAAAGWPASAWILQKYTDPDNDYGVSLSIFSGCSICGAPECEALHVFCQICKIYDCGIDHDAKEPDSVSEDGGSDHSADIGKYLKLNSAVSSFKVYNAENGNTLTYVHEDFTDDAIMRIADWKFDAQGLWYLVEFYKGGIVESSYTVDFPANPWFLQTDGTAAEAFLFMQRCATCGLPDCDGNHETETVPSVSHPSGITVSSDSGIPAGAELSVSVPSFSNGAEITAFDIKIKVPDNNGGMVEWQPIDDGKTVTISLPVGNPIIASVMVHHYIDYAPAIHENVQYVSLADASAEIRAYFADALMASGMSDHVAVESFTMPVNNGVVTFEANSFSIYTLSAYSFIPAANQDGIVYFNNISHDDVNTVVDTYYATPETNFTFKTKNRVTWGARYDSFFTIKEGSQYVTLGNQVKDNDDIVSVPVSINEDAPAGTSIKILFATSSWLGWTDTAVLNEIIVVRPVDIIFNANLPTGIKTSNMPDNRVDPDQFITDANMARFTLPTDRIPRAVNEADANDTYTFLGWNTSKAGDGTFYEWNGEKFRVWDEATQTYKDAPYFVPTADTTLYAMWERDECDVTFDYNIAGVDTKATKTVEYGSMLPMIAAPERPGYVFLGWCAEKDGSTKRYYPKTDSNPADEIEVKSDFTLYALWGVELYIDAIGGTISVQKDGETKFTQLTATNEYGFRVTSDGGTTTYYVVVPESSYADSYFRFTPAGTNKTIKGFSSGSQVEFLKVGNTVTLTGDVKVGQNGLTEYTRITFSAEDKYTVSFNTRGGTLPDTAKNPVLAEKNGKINLTEYYKVTRPGYSLDGWYDPDGVKVTGQYTVTKDITLSARWTANKHNVTVNMGSGIGSVTGAGTYDYSTPVMVTATMKPGYQFVNWKRGDVVVSTSQSYTFVMPDEDVALVASAELIPYTISYTGTDAGENPTTYNVDSSTITLKNPARIGYTFTGWTGTDLDEPTMTVTIPAGSIGDRKYTANWELNKYKVTYISNGAIEATEFTVEDSFALASPAVPDGYTFNGWKVASAAGNWTASEYAANQSMTHMHGDVTLVAKWTTTLSTSIDNGGTITVGETTLSNDTHDVEIGSYANSNIVFVPADGYHITNVSVTVGDKSLEMAFEPDEFVYPIGESGITAPISIAVTTVNTHIVTFVDQDGTELDKQTIIHGGAATAPDLLEHAGYRFLGWDKAFDDVVSDLTVRAQWEVNTYTVTFDVNGGTLTTADTATYTVEDSVEIPVPIRSGCTFNGWIVTSSDGSAENWAEGYTGGQNLTDMYGNVTLTANWSAPLSVSIDNGGTIKAAEDPLQNGMHSVAVGSYANTDIKFTPADGYRITGVTVTVGGQEVETTFEPGGYTYHIGSDGVTKAISIVVTTSNSLTVTFKDWDGTVLDTQEVTPGGAATAPDAPARVGYSFTGWDEAFDNVTTDLVVTAQYSVNSYNVTWNFDNGDAVYNVAVTYGAEIVAPTGMEKTGYQFDKWSPDIPEKMPSSDLAFKALWTPNTYTVRFDGNGHTSGTMADQSFTYDEEQALRANGFEKAYTVNFNAQGGTVAPSSAAATATFTGWKHGDTTYTDQQSVKNLTAVHGDTCTLVAQWQLGSVTLPEPSREGYIFSGWYTDADCTDSAFFGTADTVCVPPSQNMTLYAKWTAKEYTVDVRFNSDHVSITGLDGFTSTEGGLQKVVEYGTELNIEVNLKTGYEIDQVLIDQVKLEDFNGKISHKVLQNTIIEVRTKPISYLITWKNDTGDTLLTQQVPYGETPVYPDGTPTKAPAENDPYTYRFAGWTPEIQTVTGEAAYTATYDALFNFKATIDHGTITYKDASVIKELELKDVVMGSDAGTQMAFEPEAGYQIKSVSVNGVPHTVQLESDGSYIHTFVNGMRAEEKLIEVVTEPIEVVINIQFTDGSNLLEIHVQKYSDVLLAITPKTGTSINAIELTGSENSETTNVAGVSNGYIYTATGIQESVTIVVNATSKDVFCAAGSIDHGTVSIRCGETTVTSKQSAAGNYINYDDEYTFTMTADGGRHITNVDNTIFGEYTTEHPIDGVMNAHKVVRAQTEETVHNITYILHNGSDDWRTTAAYGNVVSLREAPVKSGYNFKGWWYDKDADNTMDGDELLAAGGSFTMPNHGVTMTAQWLDSRLDSPHKVYVGINMSFYNSNGGWYYSLPQNEPAVIHGLVSVRAYKDTYETTTWKIQDFDENGNKFTRHLPGAPSLYITEDVFKPEGGYVNNWTTGGAEGIFDPTGARTRACLKLSEADYEGIIQGWLDSAETYLQNTFPNTNLDWTAISKNAEDYTIIPYVVKHQSNSDDWYIDMVIQPKARYNITYKMNLENGYTSEVEAFTDNTGYGQGFQAKLANPKQATNTDRPNAEPRFLGWWYDKNDNQIVETAELYGAGELFTMPAKNVELVAQWEYPKRLKIVETTGKSSDTFFFDVVGTNGGKTVLSMTVSVQGGGYVIIDDIFTADYTVTEKNQWSWTYETGTNAITKSVAADATADTVFEFSKAKKNVCWLFDENHN